MKARLPGFSRRLGTLLANPRVFYAIATVLLAAVVAGLVVWCLVARKKNESLDLLSGQEGGTYKPLAEKIADQMGVAMFLVVGLPTGENKPETPEERSRWDRLYVRYIRRYRQHPSVLGWMVGSGSHPRMRA